MRAVVKESFIDINDDRTRETAGRKKVTVRLSSNGNLFATISEKPGSRAAPASSVASCRL